MSSETIYRNASRPLIRSNRYRRQYVALADFRTSRVIAHGRDPQKVFAAAIKKGFAHPVIIFVPPRNRVQIYDLRH
jgi:hypothetical protein